MKKKCPQCQLVNHPTASVCARCGSALLRFNDDPRSTAGPWGRLMRRAAVCLTVVIAAVAGFYSSLVLSADSLDLDQKTAVRRAIDLLERKGFADEAFLLRRVAVFRSSDNWLNASVVKESAYAATNFPFEIVTVYPEFFTYPMDDLERAAVLLHEAKHLEGADEKEAYEFVWKNRQKLGWNASEYAGSAILPEVRKQTREYVPGLFVCDVNKFSDCTESR